jgi:oxygen-independent coproporphyrinogen-3 oxidase
LAGIYLHIPFCKQACSYCNFHFSISLRRKNELIAALLSEMDRRKEYLQGEPIDTIYFGGGTPSLLQISDFRMLMEKLRKLFVINDGTEITLEANPDDIADENLEGWKDIGVNRLSIGIQSFFEEDLKWMKRAHNAEQAIFSLRSAIKQFQNITIDLIYGTPLLSNEKWKANVNRVIDAGIVHLSCYALTVEPKTPLYKMIKEHKTSDVDPDKQSEQFLLLMEWAKKAGYEHYEISNFAKSGFRSRHNSSYWQGKKYLGLGPSAHSFNGASRQWNVSNNNIYIDSIEKGIIPFEKEILTSTQRMNEYIMTSLRTIEGLDLNHFEQTERDTLQTLGKKYIEKSLMIEQQDHLKLTREGKLLADGIAAELFFEELKNMSSDNKNVEECDATKLNSSNKPGK